MNKFKSSASDSFFCLVSQYPFNGRVDVCDQSFQIDQHNDVGRVLHKIPESPFFKL